MLINLLVSIIVLYIVGVLTSYYKIQSLRKKGYKHFKSVDSLNPINWVNFIIGFIFSIIPDYVFEQYVLRLYDNYCKPNCYDSDNGKCVDCGCDAYEKALSPFSECSKGYWGRIVFNRKQYEELRKKFPVDIKIEYKNEE